MPQPRTGLPPHAGANSSLSGIPPSMRNMLPNHSDAHKPNACRRMISIALGHRVLRVLFEELMENEEAHINFLETQIELINQLGLQLYAQKHIGEPED
jgi:bacterioferritin (cytochrome b1)